MTATSLPRRAFLGARLAPDLEAFSPEGARVAGVIEGGMAAAAGAMAQGRATSAAAEGMSRNPGAAGPIRTMTIIGLALIESLVLYALLIAFLIKGV